MRSKTLLVVLLLAPVLLRADDNPLFLSDDPLKAVLTAPILQAYGQKKQEQRLYLEGHWSYREGDENVRLGVKIRTRGNYRRQVCSLPPLMLNFRKKEVMDTLFDGQDKLKMVSPCKDGERYQQLLFLEELVYDLWALYSEYHFLTRRVVVAYADTDNPDKRWQSENFLLETDEAMAKRKAMRIVKTQDNRREHMNMPETALLEVFQFMIGNVDYSTLSGREGENCCHNVRLIAPEGAETGFIPVPYDFDSSGFLNAPYATPPANVPIRKVTQRYFTGWCKEERRFLDAIEHIRSLEEEAIALAENAPELEGYTRSRALSFLKQSYKHINDDGFVKQLILNRCRGEVIPG